VKLLFVCSQNRLRSPTAEAVFSAYSGVEAISAGTNNDATTPISADLIEWADVVFCMEKVHRNRLTSKFRVNLKDKKLVVLDIPDNYEYMDSDLIRILKARVPRYVRI
jgi:predicted protein tyrosine phosphatase